MKVAFDATLWDEPITGIGLYARETVAALRNAGTEVALLGAARSGERPRKLRSRTAFTLAELPAVLRERDESIFHAAGNFNLPLQRIPGKRFVLTVHDLIPVLRPETVSRAFRWQFELWLSRSLRIADHVCCVSDYTRKDLLARYGVDPDRVSVVHNGVDHVQRIPPPDPTGVAWLDSLALPDEFVLYAGSFDVRKNVARVLDAMELLHHRGKKLTLVLAGQRWFGSGPVEERIHSLMNRGIDLRPLGYLEAPLLYALMQRASLFVFPSLFEGFGLPPLEAMSLGVPTIVSNATSLPEVCGEGAVQVDPMDAPALAREMESILSSKARRSELSESGRHQASKFSWSRAAEQTRHIYASLS